MPDNESSTEYVSLSQDVDETPLLPSAHKDAITNTQRSPSNGWFFWACVASLACSLLNTAAIIKGGRAGSLGSLNMPQKPLRRPSVYVGLDKLPLDVARAALPPSLDVFPPFFQPVDAANPRKVFPEDVHARFTFNGRVTPWDHNIILSRTISMIAQYRVHDYGMERCAIAAQILDADILASRNQTIRLNGDTSRIEIWNLTAFNELDAKTLSWRNKPVRSQLLGNLSLDFGKFTKTTDFDCGPSGSLQTFELVCASDDCDVDFWQDIYFEPRFGIYILQQPSI